MFLQTEKLFCFKFGLYLEATYDYDSYDYAQQVHYPSNPLQPGPIYFKTPRKCAIFGVCCEAIPRQVNFLIDESVLTGKGANSTIGLVHYYFGKFGLGETDAYIHPDMSKETGHLWIVWIIKGNVPRTELLRYSWRLICIFFYYICMHQISKNIGSKMITFLHLKCCLYLL